MYPMSYFFAPTTNNDANVDNITTLTRAEHCEDCDWVEYVLSRLEKYAKSYIDSNPKAQGMGGCLAALMDLEPSEVTKTAKNERRFEKRHQDEVQTLELSMEMLELEQKNKVWKGDN